MSVIVVSSNHYLGNNSCPMGEVSKPGFLVDKLTRSLRWFGTLIIDQIMSSLLLIVAPPSSYSSRMNQLFKFKIYAFQKPPNRPINLICLLSQPVSMVEIQHRCDMESLCVDLLPYHPP